MRVAVVGSRDFENTGLVWHMVWDVLASSTSVITGGARGVDTVAEHAARQRGLDLRVLPADWETYGRRAGFVRNAQVADQCDRMVAFWDGRSNGTRDAVRHALHMVKPVMLVFEDGTYLTNPQKIEEVIG